MPEEIQAPPHVNQPQKKRHYLDTPARAEPLQNERYERMAFLVGYGKSQTDAYQETGEKRVKFRTAKSCASDIARNPEFRARVQWYRLQAAKEQNVAQIAPKSEKPSFLPNQGTERAPQPPAEEDDEREVTGTELRRKAATALRRAVTSTEISQAIKTVHETQPELRPENAKEKPDPAAIVGFVASFAGMSPAQVAAEIGGLEFIAAKLVHVTKQPAAAWRDLFAALARKAKKAETAPQQDVVSPPDNAGDQTNTPKPQ